MSVSQQDREVVRELATQVMEVASLPLQDEKRAMWTKLNRLEEVRPMVWINEVQWEEFEEEEELQCRCEDKFCRVVETGLRTSLYL